MGQALDRADHVAGRSLLGRIGIGDLQIAAHASGQIDDDVGAAIADAVHHFAVELDPTAGLTAAGLSHMHMGDGRASLGSLDGGFGDFLRANRNGRVLADRVAGASDCTGDDYFSVHSPIPSAD